MPYWVFVKNGCGMWDAVRSFNAENAAWLYVEKQEAAWRNTGLPVPHYRVLYGSVDCARPELVRIHAA